MDRLLVAIDSGGTRTNSELRLEGQRELVRRFEAGVALSGYLESRLVAGVMQQILAPIEAFWRHEELQGTPVTIFIAAAGFAEISRDDFIEAIDTVVRESFDGNVELVGVANDAVTLLLGHDADAVVVAGTGSNVLVKTTEGKIYQSGGHDWVAADQGAGFWIGMDAIRQVAQDFESMEQSVLLSRFCEQYGLEMSNESQIIGRFRSLSVADSHMKADIARFSASVCSAAELGDVDAQNIVKRQSEDLADVTARAIRRRCDRTMIKSGLRLVECGGVLANEFYRGSFESQVRMRLLSVVDGGTITLNWVRVTNGIEAAMAMAKTLPEKADNWLALSRSFRPVVEFLK